ncbi:polysaccharide lyase family 8 super-sandwich domain-containing protein [Vibrio sp. DNB22_10_4]
MKTTILVILSLFCAAVIAQDSDITVTGETFEIQVGSKSGDRVVGTLGASRNVTGSSYSFSLVDSGESSAYQIETELDYANRPRGVLYVKDNSQVSDVNNVSLTVFLNDSNGLVATKNITIHQVSETQWSKYLSHLKEFVLTSKRMWGERYYTSDEVAALVKSINDNDGKFIDLKAYTSSLGDNKATQNGKDFEEAVNRIGGLGYAYHSEKSEEQKEVLRAAIVKAFNAFVDRFPRQGFADNRNMTHADRTHQWRFTDALSLPLVYILEDTLKKELAGDEDAKKFRNNVNALYQIAFDLPETDRDPERLRYFIEDDFAASMGTWSDANRGHRLRSWAVYVGLLADYNKPITDVAWWYTDYAPLKEKGSTLLPGWEPSGSFSDLKTWLDTNSRRPHRYGQSGLLPDGSLSHHVGHRQDLAMLAYGFEWYAESVFEVAELLNGTDWEMSTLPLEESTEVMLYTYSALLFKDVLDFQSLGRTFLSSNANKFGTKNLSRSIEHMEKASDDRAFKGDKELDALHTSLNDESHKAPGTHAFWNADMLVHRRIEDSTEWYSSFKMQSSRTRGAESFNKDPGMHNGSGILQIKVDGKEYADARYNWDWHVLPGLTEEWKTDAIPMQSAESKFNPSAFAGTLSDGNYGIASFHYGSENSYTSAAAKKSAFFLDDMVIALGTDVARVERGNDESTYMPIVTTIDQPRWHDTLTYYTQEKGEKTVACCIVKDSKFSSEHPTWFHQGDVGYITIPKTGEKQRHTLVTGTSVVDTIDSIGTESVFIIALNHTPNPTIKEDSYHYVLVPNVEADVMPDKVKSYGENVTVVNTGSVQGVHYKDSAKEVYQLVFHKAGSVTLSGATFTASQPMLLQLANNGGWVVTAQNPEAFNKHIDHEDDKNHKFEVVLKEGAHTLDFTTSLSLSTGSYQYKTQGLSTDFVDGQTATVTAVDSGGSQVSFNMPDNVDKKAYEYRQELYSGMPASISLGASN